MLFISSGEDLMAFHMFMVLLSFFLMLSLAWLGRLSLLHHGLAHSKAGVMHPVVRRLLKPRTPVLATWIIRSKTSPTKPRKISFPACKQRRGGVLSDVVISILMLER